MVLQLKVDEALHDEVHSRDDNTHKECNDEETNPNLKTKSASTLEIEFQLLLDDELNDHLSCLRALYSGILL